MSRFRRLLPIVLVFGLAGCPPGDEETQPVGGDEEVIAYDTVAVEPDLRRQIQDWVCDFDTLTVDSVVAFALSGDSVLEREVHDCQRMIVRGEFGPLVGVFPFTPSLGLPVDSFETEWRRIAMVHNWGWEDQRSEPYGPLGLPSGLHCLLLRYDSRWHAVMTPVETGCDPHLGQSLRVEAQDYAGPNRPRGFVFPPTARFRWHAGAGQYAIGVRCARQWCTIGTTAATSGLPVMQGELLRVVPGYYDEQPLAVRPPGSSQDTLVPGPIGRIYPTAELERWNGQASEPFWDDTLAYAAIEVISDGVAQNLFDAYVQKFGIVVAPNGRLAEGSLFLAPGAASGAAAEIRAGSGRKPAAFVARVENRHHSAEGTVRWRWMDEDEAAWVPCQKDNCCTATW